MAKRRIVPPKIDNRQPNGIIKADRIVDMLGLPSVYYVFDTQSTTNANWYGVEFVVVLRGNEQRAPGICIVG